MLLSLLLSALPLAAALQGIRLAAGCSAKNPCAVGCCSKYGFCGYGPDYCAKGVCVSTCGAKPQCGKYAAPGKESCPLNICCSQYGNCGLTSDYCGAGCQNGCTFKTPSCTGTSSKARNIAYYEGYSVGRSCDIVQPDSIDPTPWTHLNYAFAVVGADHTIKSTNAYDPANYKKFTGLKKKKPALKTYISVGGAAPGGLQFSRMAVSAATRSTFIKSAIAFMKQYGFDGIDIDWEFPVAANTHGRPVDKANFVSLVKELRAAVGTTYGITATLPAGYYNLQYFDVAGMTPYVNWFNFMAYDLHSYQDGTGIVQPHTNLTEISAGLDLLWRIKTPPAKINMGLGNYGHSYQLQSTSCTASGCPSAGPGAAGNCTGTPGILSDYEMERIMLEENPVRTYNAKAAVNWMTWAGNQWVAYDDGQTIAQKVKFADSRCLGGLFAWAVDLGGPLVSKSPHQIPAGGTALGPSAPFTSHARASSSVSSDTSSGAAANARARSSSSTGFDVPPVQTVKTTSSTGSAVPPVQTETRKSTSTKKRRTHTMTKTKTVTATASA